MNKGLQAISEQRVAKVYSLICQGKRHSEIVKYCKNEYGVAQRRAEVYITKARQAIKELVKQDIESLRAEANARYNELYRLAIEDGDYKAACYIQSRLDRINGLEIFNVKHDIDVCVFDKLKNIFNEKING